MTIQPRCRNPQRRCNRNPSRDGTRPVGSGRPVSPTSSRVWRRGGRPGRSAARCAMDRPTAFSHWRSPPAIPRLRPRLPPCSGYRWRRTPPAAGRPWSRCGLVGARSRCRIRSSISLCTDRMARRSRATGQRRCVPDQGHLHSWGRYAHAIARREHITGRSAPAPALLNQARRPPPAPKFVEWLMGLPSG